MQRVAIEAVARESGKHGKLGVLRRQGFIPAVVYGHGMAPMSVAVPVRAFERIRRTTGESAIVELQFEGDKAITTVVHEYQMNPIRDTYTHVDFLSISLDEPLTSRIPIRPIGTAIGLKGECSSTHCTSSTSRLFLLTFPSIWRLTFPTSD